MGHERKVDRRQTKFRAFQLGQPFLMQVPKTVAAAVLAGCTLITIAASHLTAPVIGYGPIFLLICAFGAWLVGNQFAVTLGMFIAVIQILNGHTIIPHGGSTDTVIDLAVQVSSGIAVVLMLGVARASLEVEWRFARIDPLTGALNRKAFFEAVEGETSSAGIVVLVFADVDGLKSLNDRVGHEAGDAALENFANRVRKAIRKGDLFARIGGDEFAIFLKVRDESAAKLLAQRLNKVLNLDPQEDETQLKCSMGVLVLPKGSKSIDAELKQADTLMYHAKNERTGFWAAISDNGELKKLVSFTSDTNSTGQQKDVLRSTERHSEIAASESYSDHIMAA